MEHKAEDERWRREATRREKLLEEKRRISRRVSAGTSEGENEVEIIRTQR